jgi:hypothetical protein
MRMLIKVFFFCLTKRNKSQGLQKNKLKIAGWAGMKKSGQLNITEHWCDLPANNISGRLIVAFIPLLRN